MSDRGRMRRGARAFTMLELLVAVSLMVMLLSVLTFVFRQSAEAVGSATETVNVVQKARNFAARVGREVGASVETYLPPPDPSKPPVLTFRVSDDGTVPKTSGSMVEFFSQTLNEGVLDTWCVRYYYQQDTTPPDGGAAYGSIYRRVRRDRALFGTTFDQKADGEPEVLVGPVRDVQFVRVPELPSGTQIDTMPSSLSVRVTFLDTWGGTKFRLAQQFYFPIYQGH
jgi:type II secretory pathway pseudopilin PulG